MPTGTPRLSGSVKGRKGVNEKKLTQTETALATELPAAQAPGPDCS